VKLSFPLKFLLLTDLVILIRSCESANLAEEFLRCVSRGFARRGKWKASDDRCRVFKNQGLGEVAPKFFETASRASDRIGLRGLSS
jgi:hypothetical protein